MKDDVLEDIYNYLVATALRRYKDIIYEIVKVKASSGVLVKVRVIFTDSSFLDIYWSPSGKYSLHYERRHLNGTLYRHDNAPHEKHRHIETFPKHFHKGKEDAVEPSYIPENHIRAVDVFLEFIAKLIRTRQ